MKGKAFLVALFIICFCLPAFSLTSCPRCRYRIGIDTESCPKCLFQINPEWSQKKEIKSVITVRSGYDAFIRHPHAENRAYKSDRNAGGDKTGEIGVWGGSSTLRYLIRFRIDTALEYYGIDYQNFNPKKAFLFLSVLSKKNDLEIPIVIYPLTRSFTPGYDILGERTRTPNGCTWFKATTAMPWEHEGGDFEQQCCSKGILKSGIRNQIDVTNIIKYFFELSQRAGEWKAPGMIIMSDPSDRSINSGFVTIYSLDTKDFSLRPELYIQ